MMKPNNIEDCDGQPRELSVRQSSSVGLVIDAGRQRQKHIKRLKRGAGRIAEQVESVIAQFSAEHEIDPDAEIIPVVLLYQNSDLDYVVISPT
jgi:hypothetical protein